VAIAVLAGGAALFFRPVGALAAGPPQIKASWATEVNATGANLRAEVNPNGFSTTYRFEYISDAAYRANLEAVPQREGFSGASKAPPSGESGIGSGTTFQAVARSLSGLSPATAYHYRPVATNSAGPPVTVPDHVLITQEFSTAFRLPDERGWELVSPVDKAGGAIAAPSALFGGGDIQAAAAAPADPTAPVVTYGSATSFGNAAGAPAASQYLSRRSPLGWSTGNISTPLDSAAYGDAPDGAPYRVFSGDLSRSLLFGGLACRGGLAGCPAPNPPLAGSGAPAGYMAYYLRDSASGTLTSLLTAADLAHSSVAPEAFEVTFAAATPDLSHIVLSSCAKLTPDAVEASGGAGKCEAKANLYEWSPSAGLALVSLLPGETAGSSGAAIGAPSGAISTDGSRVYWNQGGQLYLRDGAHTDLVEGTQGEGGIFETATLDGSASFFTEGEHLYRFAAATKAASDITPSGGVVGVLGASADGNSVYYQDGAGLALWRDGATTPVASGAEATTTSDYPPATATARVSDDGAYLAFLSDAELTDYDNADAKTGQPDTELYLYGPPAAGGPAILACASCNPTRKRARGPSTIPGALVNGTTQAYRPRVLTAGGRRLFFNSGDDLAQQDTNSQPDVYEWELNGTGTCSRSPGCVSLISSGRSPDGASFLDATANGSDAFFITGESLVGIDPPGSIDAYDARVLGGFAEASKPIPCIADACQGLPGSPEDPTPGTLVPNPGNPPLRFFSPKSHKHLKKLHPGRHKGKGKHGRGKRHGRGGR
jgi:hypothetical protein